MDNEIKKISFIEQDILELDRKTHNIKEYKKSKNVSRTKINIIFFILFYVYIESSVGYI